MNIGHLPPAERVKLFDAIDHTDLLHQILSRRLTARKTHQKSVQILAVAPYQLLEPPLPPGQVLSQELFVAGLALHLLAQPHHLLPPHCAGISPSGPPLYGRAIAAGTQLFSSDPARQITCAKKTRTSARVETPSSAPARVRQLSCFGTSLAFLHQREAAVVGWRVGTCPSRLTSLSNMASILASKSWSPPAASAVPPSDACPAVPPCCP